MYIESSLPRKEDDYANFFSDTYEINKTPLTDQYCLIFWYHMLGTGIGKTVVQPGAWDFVALSVKKDSESFRHFIINEPLHKCA